ncbi:hypothetical protein SAMN04515647_4388 [Cohaesibacter sp. ES.047]|uniref:hypothetical protein n=1 Tax=Cohaesibacter sp. ES.047 TaxID=1798205 RepID=UPI000BC0C8A5|nr:hypothetical protein [Cohaesibacter sp. ES.047]SNY94064.1 hypothetical protein SAMN04515647_4388 [Cohaesibacter sp. ES.047]
MSLMLLAVSTCLVKALKGHTLAGERVLESDPTALRFTEDGRFKTDQTGPFISIFAHTSKASGLGQQPALLANGDVEIELLTGVTATMTSVADDDGHRKFDFIDLAPSSTNMDRTLNLMHRQIVDVLLADTFWAERFRQFAVVTVVDRAGVVSSEDGQRLAARQMKIKVNVLDEPLAEEIDAYHQWVDLGDEAASLPDGVTPFASFLWGLKTSEDASDCAMADEIAAMLSGDVLEWQAIAKSMGFTRDQMMALGLNPIDFDNPEQVVTGADAPIHEIEPG